MDDMYKKISYQNIDAAQSVSSEQNLNEIQISYNPDPDSEHPQTPRTPYRFKKARQRKVSDLMQIKKVDLPQANIKDNGLEITQDIAKTIRSQTLILWVFFIRADLKNSDRIQIKKIYHPFTPHIKQFEKSPFPIYTNIQDIGEQIKNIMDQQNGKTIFKVVTDMLNVKIVIKELSILKNVIEVYVLRKDNNQEDMKKDIMEMFDFGKPSQYKRAQMKKNSYKIKKTYMSFDELINLAEEDIEPKYSHKYYSQLLNQTNQGSQVPIRRMFKNIFLSAQNNTKATLYRMNLISAIIMQPKQYEHYFQLFQSISKKTEIEVGNLVRTNLIESQVQQTKDEISKVKQKLKELQKQSHNQKTVFSKKISLEVLHIFKGQNFFHKIISCMLRNLKNMEQFQVCLFPLHLMYHAIKTLSRRQDPNDYPFRKSLWSGGCCREKQMEKLKNNPGCYVEFYGFISTSADKQRAIQFLRSFRNGNQIDCGVLYQFKIRADLLNGCHPDDHHGFYFLDRGKKNKYNEQQVIFNCFNLYKYIGFEKEQIVFDNRSYKITVLKFQYGHGPILMKKKRELQKKEKQKALSQQEQKQQWPVCMNYNFCMHKMRSFNCIGEVYFFFQNWRLAKQYYTRRNKRQGIAKQEKMNNDLMLAKILQKSGNVIQALKSYEVIEKQCKDQSIQIDTEKLQFDFDGILKQKQQKGHQIYALHNLSLKINALKKQTDQYSEDALQCLEDEQKLRESFNKMPQPSNEDSPTDKLRRVQLYRQIGLNQFKMGRIVSAEQNYRKAMDILMELRNFYDDKINVVDQFWATFKYKVDCFNLLKLPNPEQWKQQKIRQIKDKFSLDQNNNYEQLMKNKATVQNQLQAMFDTYKKGCKFVNNKKQYEGYVSKVMNYFIDLSLNESQQCDPAQKLRILNIKMQLSNDLKGKEKVQTFEHLLQEAIETVQSKDPLDLQVSTLNKKLGQTYNTFLSGDNPLQKNDQEQSDYKRQNEKKIQEKCINAYNNALHVLVKNNVLEDSSEVLDIENSLAEMYYKSSEIQKSFQLLEDLKIHIKLDPQNKDKVEYKIKIKQEADLLEANIFIDLGQIDQAYKTIHKLQIQMQNRYKIQNSDIKKSKSVLQSRPIYIRLMMKKASCQISLHHLASSSATLNKLQDLLRARKQQEDIFLNKSRFHEIKAIYYEQLQNKSTRFKAQLQFAISYRTNRTGEHLANLQSYHYLMDYFLKVKPNKGEAHKYLFKICDLLENYRDHPLTWHSYYSKYVWFLRENSLKAAEKQLNDALKLIRDIDPNQIKCIELQVQLVALLFRMSRFKQSYELLERLQSKLQRGAIQIIKQSQKGKRQYWLKEVQKAMKRYQFKPYQLAKKQLNQRQYITQSKIQQIDINDLNQTHQNLRQGQN